MAGAGAKALVALVLAACCGCLVHPGAKVSAVVSAKEPVDSGFGGAFSITDEYGAWAIVGEVMDLDLDANAGILQWRLYAKANLPVVPVESFVLAAGPILGAVYSDLDEGPGWSVDRTALLAGMELTLHWGDLGRGVYVNARWAYADWNLDGPGRAEKSYSALELGLGVQWSF